MTRLAFLTIALLATTPVLADQAAMAFREWSQRQQFAEQFVCYDPRIVTDCPAHWTGWRGGGGGYADNCHKLPPCPKTSQSKR